MDRGGLGRWGRWAAAGLVVAALAWAPAAPKAEASLLVVTRFDDPAPDVCSSGVDCSLREAVKAANTNAGPDTIQLPGGVYTLTIAGTDDAANLGDLDFTGPTEVQATGGLSATISMLDGVNDRVLEVITNTVAVTLTDLIVRGGEPTGGIRLGTNASLLLQRVIVRENRAGAAGGGGIFSNGTLTLVDSLVEQNLTESGGSGGGILANTNSVLVLTNTVLLGNSTSGSINANGGGVRVNAGVRLSMSGGALIGNTASGEGGGLYHLSEVVSSLSGVQVLSNTSRAGGGLMNGGHLTVNQSLFRYNVTTLNGGGGLRSTDTLTLTQSAVISNTSPASTGAGMAVTGAFTTVVSNTTFSDNTALLSGGAFSGGSTSFVYLRHVTVVSNTTVTGNGGGINQILHGGLENTLVAGNRDLQGLSHPDCSNAGLSLDYNLIGNSAGCALTGTLTHVISNTAALFGPLADNGGNTLTHALLPGSPALDAANPAACAPTDQRGVARPFGSGCDIGAWEGGLVWLFLPVVLK